MRATPVLAAEGTCVNPEPSILPLTWGRVARIWWAFFWAATIAGGVVGFFVGGMAGMVIAMTKSTANAQVVGGVLGGIASAPVSLFLFRRALLKEYREFRVQAVSLARVVCSKCGNAIPDAAGYCAACGTQKQDRPAAAPARPASTATPGVPRALILSWVVATLILYGFSAGWYAENRELIELAKACSVARASACPEASRLQDCSNPQGFFGAITDEMHARGLGDPASAAVALESCDMVLNVLDVPRVGWPLVAGIIGTPLLLLVVIARRRRSSDIRNI
jgi:hypothetical protein